MKVAEIPFNMSIIIDSSFKEVPEDYDEMLKGINFLFEKIDNESHEAKKAALHSLVGKYLRVVNKLEESEQQLGHAFEGFKAQGLKVPGVIAKFRLGLTYLYQEKYTRADDFLSKVLEICLRVNDEHLVKLCDHIYFTMGLSKMWQKNYTDADRLFNECLELRIVKGDIELIELTKKVIMANKPS
ncbi:tetratricopeptide repeat protein [Bacteriovorax sp. DB6_IX]|uniref:tetratricopeptide repeat protein n=1 Tax=Bacteriovorax sp. DB6_IX TaxID=1353530 RepID=UPI000389FAEF|nr:tetratricopeptide repeat protein [Bacteriovorax sp. DB6_IX]EQC52598.1 tetratricopeptide repeat protein [Bacteriovorax sp. DB6_IX]